MTKEIYEYEERAFLEEADFPRVFSKLGEIAISRNLDNKISHFFVIPGKNLSIAQSQKGNFIKYKEGAVGVGNGFREHEIPVDGQYISQVINLFEHLLGIQPQISEQFRINYALKDGIEIALKYTETWGFHLEIEKTYDSVSDRGSAQKVVRGVADSLKIKLLTEADLMNFRRHIDSGGRPRGTYTPGEFREKFSRYFS